MPSDTNGSKHMLLGLATLKSGFLVEECANHALQIHWFSIFNSFMMVIFLTGLVAMILLRTLRNDYAKYTRDDDDIESLEHDISEESGWKLVHGDVFRPPPNLALLSALLGTGVQLALLVLFVILITIAGSPWEQPYQSVLSVVWHIALIITLDDLIAVVNSTSYLACCDQAGL